MVSLNVDKILQQAIKLTEVEREQLLAELSRQSTRTDAASNLEDQLYHLLLKDGVIRNVPAKATASKSANAYVRVKISGRSLSEMLIDERK